MGFYGNITNTAKTTFAFDKIYPNRWTMDSAIGEKGNIDDGVAIGRYVLVEYSLNELIGNYLQVYQKNNKWYAIGYSQEEEREIKYYEPKEDGSPPPANDKFIYVIKNQIVYIKSIDKEMTFYFCSGGSEKDDTIEFEKLEQSEDITQDKLYYQNYQTDYKYYHQGYDSTAWIKTAIEINDEVIIKYIQIAELNTVVPTFDLVIDAPTMEPLQPHFDVNSTNVYYKLHLQPQYGLRVASADKGPSNDKTYWTKEEYDKETGISQMKIYIPDKDGWDNFDGKNIPSEAYIDAAIYYNKEAFEKQVDKDRTSEEGLIKQDNSDNIISILPTGSSETVYNQHNGTEGAAAKDIQEMRIHLPAIGNMVSAGWDVIHGPVRNDSYIDSLQGKLDSLNELKNNEIPVQYVIEYENDNKEKPIRGYLVGTSIDGDDWIKPDIHVDQKIEGITNNAISIKHKATSALNKSTTEITIKLSDNINTFTIFTPVIDMAGHIVDWKESIIDLTNIIKRLQNTEKELATIKNYLESAKITKRLAAIEQYLNTQFEDLDNITEEYNQIKQLGLSNFEDIEEELGPSE